MTTKWQEKLDSLFPSGLKMVQIEDVVEGVGTDSDNSAAFLTPQLFVLEDNGSSAVVRAFVYEFPKDVILTVLELEKLSEGVYLAKTPDDEKDYLLSSNLPKSVLEQLKQARSK